MVKKELRDGEIGQLQLGGQEVAVTLHVHRSWMAGRVGGHPDRESANSPGQLDQFEGVGKLADASGLVGGWVTTKGHEVFDTGLTKRDQDFSQLQPRVGHTDQMGHWSERGCMQHARHQIDGALARFGAASIGNRHKRRIEWLELVQRLGQGGQLLVTLGRKELE